MPARGSVDPKDKAALGHASSSPRCGLLLGPPWLGSFLSAFHSSSGSWSCQFCLREHLAFLLLCSLYWLVKLDNQACQQIPKCQNSSSVTLDKLFHVPVPQFLHLEGGHGNTTYFGARLRRLHGVKCLKESKYTTPMRYYENHN